MLSLFILFCFLETLFCDVPGADINTIQNAFNKALPYMKTFHQSKFNLPNKENKYENLAKFGVQNLVYDYNYPTISYYTKANEISNGKDTLTGHLEMMGIETKKPFITFPNGFPDELIHELEEKSGRKVIGNCVASGTEIIKELGEEQMNTGSIIVYTSADSVLQIAARRRGGGL